MPGRQAVIDYRHVIQALLRKPGRLPATITGRNFFPSSTYRRAYDRLVQDHGMRAGELEYLRLLKLTAELGINAVEGLLGEMLGPDTPAVAGRHPARHAVSPQPGGTGGTRGGFERV